MQEKQRIIRRGKRLEIPTNPKRYGVVDSTLHARDKILVAVDLQDLFDRFRGDQRPVYDAEAAIVGAEASRETVWVIFHIVELCVEASEGAVDNAAAAVAHCDGAVDFAVAAEADGGGEDGRVGEVAGVEGPIPVDEFAGVVAAGSQGVMIKLEEVTMPREKGRGVVG